MVETIKFNNNYPFLQQLITECRLLTKQKLNKNKMVSNYSCSVLSKHHLSSFYGSLYSCTQRV